MQAVGKSRRLTGCLTAFPNSLRRSLCTLYVVRRHRGTVVIAGIQHSYGFIRRQNGAVAERMRTVSRAWAL